MQRSIYASPQPRTDIAATVYLDPATNEALDSLCRRLGLSHSEALRLACRNLCSQHGIPTRSAPRHPDLLVAVAP